MHVPCDFCGSSDAGWRFPDGGFHCYKCHESRPPPKSGEPQEEQEPKRVTKKNAKLLDVTPISLTKRGIRQDTCEKWGYGAAELDGEQVQVAQYFDEKGVVCGQKIRKPDKTFLILGSIKPAGLYGKHLWRDGGRMIVVVEGEIDALSLSQVQGNKWPVVSVPNGAPGGPAAVAADVEFLEKFDKVVFMLDSDEEGRKAAVKCCEVLTPGKGHIATLPLKDANDMLKAGRIEELLAAMWGAKCYRPDDVVEGDEVWEQITREDLSQGAPWNHKGLQEKTKGIRHGEVVTLVAGTGAGKSTLCRELTTHLIRCGHKVGYIALEENIRRSALGLLSILCDKPLHFGANADILTPELKKQWESIKGNVVFYDHFGSVDSKNLLSKIRYMVKGLGVKFVVLDHLSIVVSGMDVEADERRTLDATMTAIASMAQEMNVCIILVSHLKRTEGKPHEEGKAVTLSDLRGSHSISQLSHTVVSIERDQQSEDERDVSTLRVLKCRHTGDTGEAGEMVYDRETGRLKERKTEFDAVDPEEIASAAEVSVREPEVVKQGEVVPRVRAARRKGKVEHAVEEHGPRAVGETSAKEG